MNCNKRFHFPCATSSGCYLEIKRFKMLCHDHLDQAIYLCNIFVSSFEFLHSALKTSIPSVFKSTRTHCVQFAASTNVCSSSCTARVVARTTMDRVCRSKSKRIRLVGLAGSVQNARFVKRAGKKVQSKSLSKALGVVLKT
jgi:hypothetical protein